MRLTANIGDFKPLEVIPKDVYKAVIDSMKDTDPDDPSKPYKSKAGNLMIELTWKIIEGQYTDKKVPFDNVVYAGTDKKGNAMSPFRLADLIEALQIPWACGACGSGRRVVDFKRGKGPEIDGLVKGGIYCPDCDKAAEIDVETKEMLGRPCLIAVDVEPVPGKDREKNVVKAYSVIP